MELNEIEGTPKTKLILFFIKPGMEWLESKGISMGFFPLLIYSIVFYFYFSWYKSQKVLTFTQKASKWLLIIGFVQLAILAVFRQIQIFQGIRLK